MNRYLLRRLGQAIITLIGVSMVVFLLTRMSGDPALLMAPQDATEKDIERIRLELGLDQPVHVQYVKYAWGVLRGDFGRSFRFDRPALDMFLERFPNTLKLSLVALFLAVAIGIPTGILSAVKVERGFDRFGKIFALFGQALPRFWLGIILISLFATTLKILPTSGMGTWKHYVLPSVTLAWFATASLTRLSRSSMLDVLDAEYIKMARIKGLPEFWVILKHGFRNAMSPVVTMLGLQFVALLNGAVITETIFTWPGVGRLIVEAIFARDFPVVQMCVLIASFLFVFINLFVDVLYAYIDPRIRYQ
jgi:peptide/nickel transport system permease protein